MSAAPDKRMLDGILGNDCMAVVDAIADGANPQRHTMRDLSCFELAIRMGYIDIVAAMLHAGAHVDHQASLGRRTGLSYAIEEDIKELTCKRTALMLGYGADPDLLFSYQGKQGCTVNSILDAKLVDAMPPEEVAIADLREMLDKRRIDIAQERQLIARKQVLVRAQADRRFKL